MRLNLAAMNQLQNSVLIVAKENGKTKKSPLWWRAQSISVETWRRRN